MRLTIIALVLCACVYLSAGDVAHLKAAKSKLLGRIVRAKHHKRGVLSSVPPYKLGYDIPVVTHSVVKPVVVSYPPAAAVTAVKVPLANPLTTRYPVPVGPKVPVPHPHYGLKFPHHTKTVLVPRPENHFHHHHHHVEPKPVIVPGPVHVPAPIPVPATPIVPFAQPTATVHAHPIPPPSPPVVIQPAPLPAPSAIFPAPAAHLLPEEHVHYRPVAPAPLPIQPAPAVAPLSPLLPFSSAFPYVLRPGNAVQTSFFANYPRYPLLNYQAPYFPFAPAAAPATVNQVLYERPHLHLVPQAAGHNGVVVEQPGAHYPVEPTTLLHPQAEVPHVHLQPTQPTVHLQPTQPSVHLQPDVHVQHDVHLQPVQPEVHLHAAQPGFLQPTQPSVHLQPTQPGIHQVPLEHDGWSPVQPTPHDIAAAQGGVHFGQGAHFGQEGQFAQGNQFGQAGQFGQEGHFGQGGQHQFTQEQGTQVYEHHSGDEQYHNYQNELQLHIQQQLEQAQYEQHLNNQRNQHSNVPQDSYGVPLVGQDYGQPNQDFGHGGQNFGQGQDFSQHGQNFAQGDFNQHGQDFGQGQDFNQQQPAAEYGVPHGAEGRSSEGDDEQLYQDHIPLKLQPPLEKPLEHFQR